MARARRGIRGDAPAGRPPSLPSVRPAASPGVLPTVLVVDADQDAGSRLAGYFAGRGYRTAYTTQGEEALSLVAAGGVAVVIVDVALGDMSGHALVSRLKPLAPDVHVLVTTGDYRPELEVRARQIGILHYAHKPIDQRRLLAIVASAIRGSCSVTGGGH